MVIVGVAEGLIVVVAVVVFAAAKVTAAAVSFIRRIVGSLFVLYL